MESLGAQLGHPHIAYGMNADDTRDYRPGQRAAEQHAVLARSPTPPSPSSKSAPRQDRRLFAVGPSRRALPVFARRYGRTVTREVLEQVERAEESLRQLAFTNSACAITASCPR